MTWVTDTNGNKCSVEYFRSKEKAQEALDSLKDCRDCTNCARCVDCADCVHCVDCVDCADCADCVHCVDCVRCVHCADCVRCVRCVDCVRCVHCADCVRCVRCVDCVRCEGLKDTNKEQGTLSFAVPVIPDLHREIYTAASAPGALNMGDWHTCEKTHCRAGWAVTLAGAEGKALENHYGTTLSAMMIYDASCPGYKISPVRFYDDNDAALADMKRLAQAEAAKEESKK